MSHAFGQIGAVLDGVGQQRGDQARLLIHDSFEALEVSNRLLRRPADRTERADQMLLAELRGMEARLPDRPVVAEQEIFTAPR
jgi:hypothetical protein